MFGRRSYSPRKFIKQHRFFLIVFDLLAYFCSFKCSGNTNSNTQKGLYSPFALQGLKECDVACCLCYRFCFGFHCSPSEFIQHAIMIGWADVTADPITGSRWTFYANQQNIKVCEIKWKRRNLVPKHHVFTSSAFRLLTFWTRKGAQLVSLMNSLNWWTLIPGTIGSKCLCVF